MKRSKFTLVVYFIIFLAIIGVFSQLVTNPGTFFKNILTTIGIAVVLFGVLYYFFAKKKKGSSHEMKKYKQAVKQSNAKYKKDSDTFSQKTESGKKTWQQSSQPKRKARKRSHLRVIDGYKDKGKNRANY